MRRYEAKELGPRNNGIHLRQKRTLAGAFSGEFESGGGEAKLFHVDITSLRPDWMAGFCRYSLSAADQTPGGFGRTKSYPLTGKCRVNPTPDHRPLTRTHT